MAFDVKQMSRNDQVIAGAGIAMLLVSFLDWFSVNTFGFNASVNAWRLDFFGAKLAVLCSLAAAVWVLVRAAGNTPVQVKSPHIVTLALAIAAVLLIIIQWTAADDVPSGIDAGWSIGFYLALVLAIVQAIFAFLSFQAAGGTAGTTATSSGDYPTPPPPPTV